jgi:hypothetical protein
MALLVPQPQFMSKASVASLEIPNTKSQAITKAKNLEMSDWEELLGVWNLGIENCLGFGFCDLGFRAKRGEALEYLPGLIKLIDPNQKTPCHINQPNRNACCPTSLRSGLAR